MEDQYLTDARAWRAAVHARKQEIESMYDASVDEPMPSGFQFTALVIGFIQQLGDAEKLAIEADYDPDRLAPLLQDWLERELARAISGDPHTIVANMLFLASGEVDWEDVASATLDTASDIQKERWRATGKVTEGSPFPYMDSWQIDPEKLEELRKRAVDGKG